MKKIAIIFLLSFIYISNSFSQILTTTPEHPTVDDSITLIYDATQGNAALVGYSGNVYMYTGVITTQSANSHDWKNIVNSGWCVNSDTQTLMQYIGNNKYTAKFNIRKFYKIDSNTTVLFLAFVFRGDNCTTIGRNADGSDIFYPVNQLSANYKSFSLSNDTLNIICSSGTICITPYNENIFNINSAPFANDTSKIIVAHKETVNTQFEVVGKYLKFSTDSASLVIDTTSLNFNLVYHNDTILSAPQIFNFSNSGIIYFDLNNNEQIYGSGSHAIPLNHRSKVLAVNNQAHYGYSYGETNLNITLPYVCSSNNYAVLIDNYSLGTLDIGSTFQNSMTYSYAAGNANVYLIAGNYSEITNNIAFLTGHQPLPPIWALGYIQSKYGYQTQTEAQNIVNQIHSADYPLDAIVLDLYWFGSPSTMGNLNWYSSNFPNPTQMMTTFKNIGVKTIAITETYFTTSCTNWNTADANGYFAKNSGGTSYILNGFWAGNASLLDIFNPAAQNWFWQFYKTRTNEGVAGWWTDLGEPESHPSDMIHYGGKTVTELHNDYSLEWEKTIYDKWTNDFPNKRLFNLSRSGFMGMQRYSTFPWSGDISRSFDGLKAQVPIMLSMGLSGVGYMHSDVGGFVGSDHNEELFTRWVEMAAFVPVFRIHGTGTETSPTSYTQATQTIVRKYIKLRYSLLPYNYTLAYENSVNGTPLARTIDYYEPQNLQLQNINDQYFWGDNFIIAPVLTQGQTSRTVKLPKGDWIDWNNNNNIYTGNSTYTMSAPIDNIPILVKAGSFIPTVRNLYSTDNYKADTLFVKYFPDVNNPTSSFTMFDDDKLSTTTLADNKYVLITFSGNETAAQTQIDVTSQGAGYANMPNARNFVFEIHRFNANPTNVAIESSNPNSSLLGNSFLQYSQNQ